LKIGLDGIDPGIFHLTGVNLDSISRFPEFTILLLSDQDPGEKGQKGDFKRVSHLRNSFNLYSKPKIGRKRRTSSKTDCSLIQILKKNPA
jgi:hypothetical protein